MNKSVYNTRDNNFRSYSDLLNFAPLFPHFHAHLECLPLAATRIATRRRRRRCFQDEGVAVAMRRSRSALNMVA